MAIRRSDWAKVRKPTENLEKWGRGGYYVRSAESGRFVGRNHRHDADAVKRDGERPERPS